MSVTGKRIHDRRITLGLSVDELAAKIGKNRATIYRYENEEIENVPVAIISSIASALDTSPAYLMGWRDEPSSETENKKAPTPQDERTKLFVELFTQLSPEQQDMVLAQLKGIVAGL